MRKRIFALVLVTLLMSAFIGSAALAANDTVSPYRAGATVSGGLAHQSGSSYQLWGCIEGKSGEQKSIRAELYLGSTYITSVSASGASGTITASKNVSLSSGTYRVDVYGTTTTASPSASYTIQI